MDSEFVMLRGAEPRKILNAVIDKKAPAVLSYLSKGRWHIAKVMPVGLGADRFVVALWPRKKPHPMNIRPGQAMGVSVKYDYGKFIFQSTVLALEPGQAQSGGNIALSVPQRVEIVQRRSYFRVSVPWALRVNVILWPRSRSSTADGLAEPQQQTDRAGSRRYCQGRLADISAGGAQVVIDAAYKAAFKKGQFLGLRFTPMPYETSIMFNAQLRSILPTADGSSVCLGLQAVGLEASPEGRCVLQQLCGVVERYYQMNQSSAKQQDMQPTQTPPVYG